MLSIKLNVQAVVDLVKNKVNALSDKDYLLRPVAFDEIDLMTQRIHVDGKAADDSQIGAYSSEYMKVRTGNFGNSDRVTRGTRKGQLKTAGVFTRGSEKGSPRPRYNRDNSTSVILSLTRQLENGWSVIATARGYGIGFLNPLNYNKARWAEATYKKKIFSLSESERQHAIDKIHELTIAAFK